MGNLATVRWTVASGACLVVVGTLYMMTGTVAIHAGQERGLGEGVYSDSQANRGRRVYRQACASCHASGLEGGEMGPGLLGAPFLDPWEGESLGELMALVRETMPQDNPGGLTDEDYVDVLAYMLKANDFPACECELTADSVEHVVIEAGP